MHLWTVAALALLVLVTTVASAQELLPNRDVFVRSGAPEGGDGTRERPYSSIQ